MAKFEPNSVIIRLMNYNWQHRNWPNFKYEADRFDAMASQFREISGQSTGVLLGLSEQAQEESLITLLVVELLKTSAIEGEMLSRGDLISSIKKNLGFASSAVAVKDKRSEGIAELMVQSRRGFAEELSETTLFDWHNLLMRGSHGVKVGKWRTHAEPMQIVSGAMGRETVHFEAPPSERVPAEMQKFIAWFNATGPKGAQPLTNPILRSAVAHLYFESIHPFEDGNGRIGRFIAEKVLSQNVGRPVLLSLSSVIEADKKKYYAALQKASQSLEIDDWIVYFGDAVLQAQRAFVQTISFSIKKSHFFDQKKSLLNNRQQRVVSRMLAEGEDEFTGGINARKYQAIAKVSKATATRDLQDLVEKQILVSKGGGRSTNYQVNLEES